ncbi:MAG: sigma 54-interacting transcriptional regulator [Spirochaetia bacterium]|nr:sigma 54-interacting transcriptional regulator [Spirochaetia bacterium]
MPSIQIVSQNIAFRHIIKSDYSNEFEIFISSTLKEGLRNLNKLKIDILLVDLSTIRIVKGAWIKKLSLNKDIEGAEVSILFISPIEYFKNKIFKNLIKTYSQIQDIFWLSKNSFEDEFFKESFLFFMVKNIDTMQKRRNRRLLNLELSSLIDSAEFRTNIPDNKKIIPNFKNAPYSFLAGESNEIKKFRTRLEETAISKNHILILGETSIESISTAYYIHHKLNKNENPFIHINTKAIPNHLQEERFFGVFSNDSEISGIGVLENSANGTLFIESIESLSWEMQQKLLQVLRKKDFTKKNSTKKIRLKSRLIFCSNLKLETLVEKGLFRQDLFFHIQIMVLKIPSLEKRYEDFHAIINNYQSWFNTKNTRNISINAEAKLILGKKPWKNIQYLYKYLENLFTISDTEEINKNLITLLDNVENKNNQQKDLYNFIREDTAQSKQHLLFESIVTGEYEPTLEEIEKEYINKIMRTHKNNISETSRVLGISRKTLYQKLKNFSQKANNSKIKKTG